VPRKFFGAPLVLSSALLLLDTATVAAFAQRLDGFNVIATPGHPFGSTSAEAALLSAKRLGATTIAVVPFLWQPTPSSPDIVRGADTSDDALRTAIRQTRALGFVVIVKPHVWIPRSWAGAVEPSSQAGWRAWFVNYRREIERIARIASEEDADALAVGTELTKTIRRPEWLDLIASVRRVFPRTLLYFAHNYEEVEAVPFWAKLDAIGVTLYPPLDADPASRHAAIRQIVQRLDALAERIGKPIFVGEVGLRSAQGANAKPWESAEERRAAPDPLLQANVLADWLAALDEPQVEGVLIWRWFTNPAAGGPQDTDFTVQGKPAERVLHCAFTGTCPVQSEPIPHPAK
jgi:sugar phosphate isomerase/epimerase